MHWVLSMRKCILSAIVLFGLSNACYAAFVIFQTYSVPQIHYNIVTDGGAVCDGVTNAAPAFATFNTWALANQGDNQVVLTIPNGSNCFFGSGVAGGWASGIKNLIVEGTGATLNSVGGSLFQLGGLGMCDKGLTDASGCSARIQSISAGATQVTLTSASLAAGYISRFTIGSWIMLGGISPQSYVNDAQGFPSNIYRFEWRQITNTDGGTGVITLSLALTNSYLDTWPLYNSGTSGNSDKGGPATIWVMNSTWPNTAEYRGLTISQGNNQTYAQLRNVTYRNVTFTGGFGAIPTQNETWTAINCSWPTAVIETDKLIGTMTMDGVTANRIDFQSASVNLFVLQNSTITTMFGSATRTEITDTAFTTLRPGAFAYGQSTGPFICTRCDVTDFQFTGGITQRPNPSVTSMSSGVISFLNTDEVAAKGPPARVFVPSGNVYFNSGGNTTIGLFQSQALTQDATNTFIQTNEAGGFPDLTTIGGAPGGFLTHPAPQFTCDDCTGDPELVATNIQEGATPLAPLGQFSKRSYAPTVQTNNLGNLGVNGRIVSLTIDVTQASTASGALILNPTGQSHLFTIKQSDWTVYDWVPTINLKQAGTRVITPSGATCNGSPGACAGDTCTLPASGCYTLPEAVWIKEAFGPGVFGTFNGTNPLFTITVVTDQGVVP